jgi:hypothetical protein
MMKNSRHEKKKEIKTACLNQAFLFQPMSSSQNQFYSQISKASELFSMIINPIDYSEYRFEEAILCLGIGSI